MAFFSSGRKPDPTAVLLTAYAASIALQRLPGWPWEKVQLPELVFLLLIGVVAVGSGRSFVRFLLAQARKPLLWPMAALAVSVGITCVAVGRRSCWVEWAGLLYLMMVALTTAWVFQRLDRPGTVRLALTIFSGLGVLAAATGLAGLALNHLGLENPLAWPRSTYYPYFGYTGRARGFMPNPNMLFSILAICLLFQVAGMRYYGRRRPADFAALALMLLGAAATLSKEALLLAAVALTGWAWIVRRPVWLAGAGLALAACLYFSHLAFFRSTDPVWPRLAAEPYSYIAPRPVAAVGAWLVFPTCYAVLKQTAVLAGLRSFPLGIGPGRHNAFVAGLKAEGRYPPGFALYDPHCTYTGAFGELGLTGLLALLTFYALLAVHFRKLLQRSRGTAAEGLVLAFALSLLYIALEGLVLDTLNFRHFWLLAGCWMVDAAERPT